MKKVFFSNIPTFFVLGFLLLLLDYNNLSTLESIFIATSITAFIAFLLNLASAYWLNKIEKDYI
ncbi:hypothetical protein [Bacillus mycoides]|uniref:hypothetical protein n=1 Tax=Bacillus mycoides TaxID=1405 RepID=UPI002E227668|nr:hypothetical protein [Bacillus mycoides]MED1024483.1 hypothetical protein [Bacillus mycoides]MED1053284.1 hypothetical protein [Bacillus mycoides]